MSGSPYKIGQAAERLGVTKRTITHYMEKKLLIPEETPDRPGMLNRFGEQNFYEILLIQELARNGFNLELIREIMKSPLLQSRTIAPGKELIVVYDGHTDNCTVKKTAADEQGRYRLKMAGRKSATVIDVSGLRSRAAELIE